MVGRPGCLAELLPGIIASFAFIVSLFGGIYCKFISFTDANNGLTLSFGIWYYQSWGAYDSAVQGTVVLETCENYPSGTNIDSYWRCARAFSTMAIIIGGVITFWALLGPCFHAGTGSYKTGGIAYMLCCLFMGLSLLLLNSNACHNNNLMTTVVEQTPNLNLSFPSSCSMGPGAQCTIAATVLWFVAGVAALKVNPAPRPPITSETHDVTYTKRTGEDGTAVVTETVVKGEPVPVSEKVEEAV